MEKMWKVDFFISEAGDKDIGLLDSGQWTTDDPYNVLKQKSD